MLDLKMATFNVWEERIGAFTKQAQTRIRETYLQIPGYVAYMTYLMHIVHDVKTKSMMLDVRKLAEASIAAAEKVGDVDMATAMLALDAMTVFNRMDREYFFYKKAHVDKTMPYAVYDACVWYPEAIRLVQTGVVDNYPLVSGWVEFFVSIPCMAKPERMPLSGGGRDPGVMSRLWEYTVVVKNNKFDEWYRMEKGYGKYAGKGFGRDSVREMYAGELSAMGADELATAVQVRHWGRGMVRAEIERRAKERHAVHMG